MLTRTKMNLNVTTFDNRVLISVEIIISYFAEHRFVLRHAGSTNLIGGKRFLCFLHLVGYTT